MPELPDLMYIKKYLDRHIVGRTIAAVHTRQPIIIRTMTQESIELALTGQELRATEIHGPFLRLDTRRGDVLVINLMLAGRLQHQRVGEKPEGYLCLACELDDHSSLNLCDEKKMAKVYCARQEQVGDIPKYGTQGVDILSASFTESKFRAVASANSRRQVRVFINDHSALSAIGNAYADEILFTARVHPKTFVARLTSEETGNLFRAINEVMTWGIRCVEEAGAPIHKKVRDHMKVRNRKGEPCPRCGTTIRREGVRGHDVYFCPSCQPASRHLFLDWSKIPGPDSA